MAQVGVCVDTGSLGPLPGPPAMVPAGGVVMSAGAQALAMEQGILGPASPIPTQCLLLKNMFDPKECVLCPVIYHKRTAVLLGVALLTRSVDNWVWSEAAGLCTAQGDRAGLGPGDQHRCDRGVQQVWAGHPHACGQEQQGQALHSL